MSGLKQIYKRIWAFCAVNFPVISTKILYKRIMGNALNLKNPHKFSEKLQYLKLYNYSKDEVVTSCIDKFYVRDYVRTCGCSEILNKLLYHWNKVEDIEWDLLPDKFALKCTHGCGYNIICQDKTQLDIQKTKRVLSEWMNTKYGIDGVEMLYEKIEPSIICEEFIDSYFDFPSDYKFFCSYGDVQFLYVDTRKEGESFINYFYPDWTPINVKNKYHDLGSNIEKPEHFELMKKYCKMLGDRFPITRIDFYCENNRVIFGEITFLPSGGFCKFDPSSFDEEIGQKFPIN